MKSKNPLWIIFPVIILGMIVGSLTGKDSVIFGIKLFSIFDLGGKLFINSLMLVVVPLVASSIITGVSRMGNSGQMGKIGLRIFFWFLFLNFLAIVLSFIITNLFHSSIASSAEALRTSQAATISPTLTSHSQDLSHLFLQLIPPNIVAAFAEGQMLGIIFFSLIFGFVIAKVEKEYATTMQNFFQGIFQSMIKITQLIMKFLPIGIFCLIAKQFALTGWDSLRPLTLYFFLTVLGLFVFILLVIPLVLKFVAKVPPYRLFKAMFPALITAFSTCSSAACLPITMNCLEKRAGVSNKISSLVLPLGLSLNLAGSSFYIFLTTIFVMQTYGVDLSLSTQILIIFLSLFLGLGEAGVPSASLIVIIAILKIFNIPLEGIGLFLAVDRFLDMFRTMTNVFTNSTSAVLIATSQEEKVLTKTSYTDN